MRVSTFFKIFAVLIVAVVVALYIALKSMDFDEYRGIIAERAKAATGRVLDIKGSFDLKLFTLTPTLTVDDISFANAPWGSRPDMMRLRRLEVEVAVMPLIFGEVNVKRLVLIGPDVLLETDGEGKGNWEFEVPAAEAPAAAPGPEPAEAAGGEASVLPVVNVVRVEDARLTYRDGTTGKSTSVSLGNFTATAANVASPLHIKASGTYNGESFDLTAKLGALALLLDPGESSPLSLNIRGGGADIGLEGEIREPMAGKGLDLSLTVSGEKISTLSGLAGTDLPPIGPYRLSAKLSDRDGSYRASGLALRVGDSSLTGEVTVKLGERLSLDAKIEASLIDIGDFVPPGGTDEDENIVAAPETKAATPMKEKEERVFSADPLPLDALRAVDAKVSFKAAEILVRGGRGAISLEKLAMELSLDKGILVVKPFKATLSGGAVNAGLTINASQPQTSLAVNLDVKEMDVGALLEDLEVTDALTGKFDSTVRVGGRGESVAQIMAGLQGNALVVMEDGTLRSSYYELLSSNIVSALTPWAGENDVSKVNCVVSRFDIKKGLATSTTLLVDTSNASLTGEGWINLATEEIDFTLTPHTRDVSLMSLAVPIRVTGTLANPSGYPDMTGVVKGVAGAVGDVVSGTVGFSLGLPLGLLGLSGREEDTVGGKDICAAAISGKAPARAKAKPETAGVPAPPAAASGPATAESRESEEPEEVKGVVKSVIEGVGGGLMGIGEGLREMFD